MNKDTQCLNYLVQLNDDIEGTCLKQGFVGLVTADLEEVFAVYFRKEDVGDIPWYSFDPTFKVLFDLIEEDAGEPEGRS